MYKVTGGTFTVTNLGAEGIDIFAPIINPPQTAILAVGKLAKKPIVVGDLFAARSHTTLSLIYDQIHGPRSGRSVPSTREAFSQESRFAGAMSLT